MSRTFRKRYEKHWTLTLERNDYYIINKLKNNKKFIEQQTAQYKTRSEKYYTYKLPKCYRNMINRTRRAHDKAFLYKDLNFIDYEGIYDPWNCKTSNSWGYW